MPRSAARQILVAPQAKILQMTLIFEKIDFWFFRQKLKMFALKKFDPP